MKLHDITKSRNMVKFSDKITRDGDFTQAS